MQPNVSEDINKIMPSITFRVLNKNGCEEGFIYLFLQGIFL